MNARHIGLGLSLILAFAWSRAEAQQDAPHAQRGHAQQAQVQVIYVEQAPVQGVPFQTVPVQAVPVQAVPVQTVPVQTAPMQSVPADGTLVQGVPLQAVPYDAVPAAQPVRGIRLGSWPLLGGADGAKHEALNRRGYWCDSHIDSYGCQNWRTQCQFVFGSCRSFFGEPCRPAPPLFQGNRNAGLWGDGANCSR